MAAPVMPSSSWLHLSAVLSLVCLLNGDTRASPGLRAARIATFDRGTEGWRILPSLPSASEAGSENVTVSVSEANSPGYFLAPNEVVSQIRAAAAQTFGSGTASLPSTVVRVSLEVPETCWTASMGWRCSARLAIVGSRCSVHKTFALPERERSMGLLLRDPLSRRYLRRGKRAVCHAFVPRNTPIRDRGR
ncbi:MAG: hypothetical protein ACPIOQ_10605 [Promethearchaeia archaeon]